MLVANLTPNFETYCALFICWSLIGLSCLFVGYTKAEYAALKALIYYAICLFCS
jgi:hypothetical protein